MVGYGYRATLPNSVVQRLVPREPGVGSVVAEGIGQVAGAVGRGAGQIDDAQRDLDERLRLQARAATVADRQGALAQHQLDVSKRLEAERNAWQPGSGTSWEERATEILREEAGKFQDTLGDDTRVGELFNPILSRWVAGGIAQERGWETQTRVKHIGQQHDFALDTAAGAVFANPNGADFDQRIADFDAAIETMPLDAATKAALRQRDGEKLAPALLDGLLAQGKFDAVDALLQSGRFDGYIGGADGRAAYGQRTGAGRAMADRAAEAAAADARAAALEGLKQVDARIDAGKPPTQAEINTRLAAAKAAGVPDSDLIRYADAGAKAVRGQIAQGQTTGALEASRAALQAKVNGGAASDDERAQLGAIDTELKLRDDKDGDDLGTLWKAGEQGQFATMQRLAAMPPERRFRVADKLGENVAVLAGLDARTQAIALQGKRVRQDRPDAFMPLTDKGAPNRTAPRDTFNRLLGPALMNDLGGRYSDMLDTAMDIFAGSQANAGSAGGWDERAFAKAARIAFGGTKRANGKYQGGIDRVRGRMTELPDGWTADEFDQRFSRTDFAARGVTYSNGAKASNADVVANFRPVVHAIDDDGTVYYRLENARGVPLKKAGRDWLLPVGRSPSVR